jgi:heme/copper-type cytochrome/quinol oxidase subunit 3
MTTRVLDVSHLPEGTADSRSLLWWGNVGMLAIEGTMFALLVASYLFLKMKNLDWPPQTVQPPNLLYATIGLVLLVLSVAPMLLADRNALRDNVTAIRIGLALCVVIGIAFLWLRAQSVTLLGFKWSDHAYGSIIWTLIGMHTFHTIAATGESLVLLIYALSWPVTKKQLLDIRCTAVYWYFVVAWWVPLYFIVYIVPYHVHKGWF